jgi:phenylalanyl-tRNA synthetase alpha chain
MEIKYLNKEELQHSLNIKDLSDNTNGIHSINLILDQIKLNLKSKYNLEPTQIRNSPIVNTTDNYDKLYYPKDDITKSSRYTRWVDETHILRTHTTSGVPKLLQNQTEDDSIYLLPGLVYRRDIIDKTHVGEPHQLDIWRVSNKKKYDRQDLLDLVQTIIDAILPNSEWRYNETSHYYTKDGIEVEVYNNGQWLEILECGLILPKLLDDNGLNSNIWSGLALGVGLDRAVMIKKQIHDIRLLRHQDERISRQMLNLDLYKEVSNYPQISRDISIAILNDMDDELLGDEIRNLIENADIIEEISIKSETNYDDLPKHVSERLGMDNNMKNVLVNIKMRALGTSITKVESNGLINQLYVKIHKGTKGYVNI